MSCLVRQERLALVLITRVAEDGNAIAHRQHCAVGSRATPARLITLTFLPQGLEHTTAPLQLGELALEFGGRIATFAHGSGLWFAASAVDPGPPVLPQTRPELRQGRHVRWGWPGRTCSIGRRLRSPPGSNQQACQQRQ